MAVLSQVGSNNDNANDGKGVKGKGSAAAVAAAATIVADSTADTPNSVTMAAIKMARCVGRGFVRLRLFFWVELYTYEPVALSLEPGSFEWQG